MNAVIKPAAVVFAADPARLARFYVAMTGLSVVTEDRQHTVLESETFQLVLHAMSGDHAVESPPVVREDACIKLAFPVASLAQARATAATLGGQVYPLSHEWQARGFRACDGIDPEGNVVQFREIAA